jgi:Tfp pilus assembly protein PilX
MVRGNDKIVRITARGFGMNANSEVVLQSYFRPFEVTVLP